MPKEFSFTRTATEPVVFNPAAREALCAFRTSKPWAGSYAERVAKFRALHASFNHAYSGETVAEFPDGENDSDSTGSHFDPTRNAIVWRGRLSVVTYLNCWLCSMNVQRPDVEARRLFRWFFPRSFRRARRFCGMLLARPRTESVPTEPVDVGPVSNVPCPVPTNYGGSGPRPD